MTELTPTIKGRDEGNAIWFNQDLLVVKAGSRETGGAFLLIEEHSRRGKVTPLHTHPDATETFYVLQGEVLVHIDGEEHTAGDGGVVSVPAGVPHAFLVTSETARMMLLLTPGSEASEAFFRDGGEPAPRRELPPEGPFDISRVMASAKKHGSVVILGPPPFGEPAS